MKKEFTVKPISGYFPLLAAFLFGCGAIAGFLADMTWPGLIFTMLFVFTYIGFTVIYPNGSCVMVLFGAYSFNG